MKKMRAAVIGSGFGGLSVAVRLQSSGYQVTLFEKRQKLGGRAYVYEQDGFTFDAGPTVVTAPECLEEIFQIAKKNMHDYCELTPLHPFYRLFWEDGYCLDYSNDLENLRQQIREKSPQDEEGYLRFLQYSEKVYQKGYVELGASAFLDWWSMIRVAPELIKVKAYQSVYRLVSSYIQDDHLRQAFSFNSLLIGGNPFRASAIYALIHYLEHSGGIYYAKGGTHALVRGLARLFTDLGGQVEVNSEIKEVATENSQVKGIIKKTGEFEEFDLVVSNADVMHTYQNLLASTKETHSTVKRLKKMRYSMSLFLIYFGTKKKYPQMAHHNVLFGPRYRELITDIFDRGILADDFSLYLHCPSQTDPTVAPEGNECFYVLSPVPHLGKGKINWKEEGPKYAKKILSYLDQHYLPGLMENLVTQKIFTPENFEKELNAYQGNCFSIEPTLLQSAYFRVTNRDPKVSGLYFVGAGTHPGAGIPGVVNSAKATAKLILQDYQNQTASESNLLLQESL